MPNAPVAPAVQSKQSNRNIKFSFSVELFVQRSSRPPRNIELFYWTITYLSSVNAKGRVEGQWVFYDKSKFAAGIFLQLQQTKSGGLHTIYTAYIC